MSAGFDSVVADVLVEVLLGAGFVGDVVEDEIFFFVGRLDDESFLLLLRQVDTFGVLRVVINRLEPDDHLHLLLLIQFT